jgi:hypothetical protein
MIRPRAELPKGQITIQGLVTLPEATEGEPVRVAITGGTGDIAPRTGC